MITKLNQANKDVARQIYNVFQRSYAIEAKLIGTQHFPPLSRRVLDIAESTTQFFGYFENKVLAGVIEVSLQHEQLDIDSLTVDPDHFKKGIATQLINFVLVNFEHTEATVETAVANAPAITLYQKQGFTEYKRWTPSHGIEKIAFLMKNSATEPM
ncbi:GNAT family N-acetyltransferase [Pseudoalteromonas xiamenensis]